MRLTINHINGRLMTDSSAHKRFRSKRRFNVFFPAGTQHFTVFYILKEPPSKVNNSSETLRKLSKRRKSGSEEENWATLILKLCPDQPTHGAALPLPASMERMRNYQQTDKTPHVT